MEIVAALIIGLFIGVALGYFALKSQITKNHVAREQFTEAEQKISALQIDLASRLSRQEVADGYVTRDLHEALRTNLNDVTVTLKGKEVDHEKLRSDVLRLTTESEQKLSKAEVEKSYVAKESFDIVNGKLNNAESELSKRDKVIQELTTKLTELRQKEEHLNEKLGTFKDELQNLHKQSQDNFKNLANEVLEEKKKLFVDENRRELGTILNPLKDDLTKFKDKVEATRKEDIQDLTSLKNEIGSLQKLNQQLSDDAKNLATALKSEVKMQGNWGEDRLNMILETEGLQRYIDYSREEVYRDDEQEKDRKPDFILRLPDGKHIVIDSKVSLTAYVNYFNGATAIEKAEHLKKHLKSVNDHIDALAAKNYHSLTGLNTPDYVFMFMPVESALTLALNQDAEIFNRALKKKIILITPTTLVATLKVVKILWQKENQVKNVEEIFKQCGALYNKFVDFLTEMEMIGTSLQAATKAHATAMYDLTTGTNKGSTLIGRFEAIRKLEAKVSKRIPEKYIREIEILPDDEVTLIETGEDASKENE